MAKRMFLALATLLATITGMLLGLYEKGRINDHKRPTDSTASQSRPALPLPIYKIDAPEPTLARALVLYRHGRFAAADKVCQQLLKGKRRSAARLTQLARRCHDCRRLLLFILPRPGDALVDLLITDDQQCYCGDVLLQDASGVQMHLDGVIGLGVRWFPRARVAQMRQIPLHEYQAKLQQRLEQFLVELDWKNSAAIIALIELYAVNRLFLIIPRIIEHGEKSNPKILKKLVAFQARRLYGCFLASASQPQRQRIYRQLLLRWFPESTIAQEFSADVKISALAQNSHLSPPQPTGKDTETPKTKQPSEVRGKKGQEDQSLRASGDRYFKLGLQHLRRSLPGKPNFDRELQTARQHFYRAMAFYQRARAKGDGDGELERRLQDTSEYYHHCTKQTRLPVKK